MKQSLFLLFIIITSSQSRAESVEQISDLQRQLLQAGDEMLENLEVSYVYGGSEVGSEATCNQCNSCLEIKSPAPKQRLTVCPVCSNCSIDCSHFTKMVYGRVGLDYPYLTTSQMLSLNASALDKKYGLVAVGHDASNARPGDLLVYSGHVVLLERVKTEGRKIVGDVIHATGGKDLKGAGLGIQRERAVTLASFRGELLRILRHKKLLQQNAVVDAKDSNPATINFKKLRKIEKR